MQFVWPFFIKICFSKSLRKFNANRFTFIVPNEANKIFNFSNAIFCKL
jgi:hypothetical protein